MNDKERIQEALDDILAYGGIDGGHHKQWALDQVVRILTGCPIETVTLLDCKGDPFEADIRGKSDSYRKWLKDYSGDEDDDDNFYGEWDTGIAP